MAFGNDSELNIIVRLKDEVSQKMNQMKQQVSSFSNTLSQNAGSFLAAGAGITAFGAGIAALGGQALKAAADSEQTTVAFTTMLGSAEKARKFMAEMAAFAAKTPFELKGLEQASKSLLAYGVTQEQVLPNLRMLGDIASGVGMDKLPNLIMAFGQVRAAGRLTGAELRQFTEAGVPLLEELSKVTGMAVSDMVGNIGDLKIPFEQVQQALGNLTGEGGRFFNLMGQQSETFSGKMSTLRDNIDLFLRTQGKPLVEFGKRFVNVMIDVLAKVNQWTKDHPQLTKAIMLFVGALGALALIVGPILIGLGAIGVLLMTLAPIAAAIGISVGALIGTLILIPIAIAAIVAAGYLLVKNWEEVQALAGEVWGAIATFFTNLWERISTEFKQVWDNISNFLKTIWQGIVDVFKYGAALAVGLVIEYFKLFGVDIVAVFETIKSSLSVAWEFIKNVFFTSLEIIKNLWTGAWNAMSAFLSPILDLIKVVIGSTWDWIVTKFKMVSTPLKDAWNALWEALGNSVKTVWSGVQDTIKASLNWIIDRINDVINAANRVAQAGAGAVGINIKTIPTLPRFEFGGVVPGAIGQEVLVMAHGQEQIIPAGQKGQGQSINININNPVVRSDDDLRKMEQMMNKVVRDLLLNYKIAG
jgi:tape measure domain-containing protein